MLIQFHGDKFDASPAKANAHLLRCKALDDCARRDTCKMNVRATLPIQPNEELESIKRISHLLQKYA